MHASRSLSFEVAAVKSFHRVVETIEKDHFGAAGCASAKCKNKFNREVLLIVDWNGERPSSSAASKGTSKKIRGYKNCCKNLTIPLQRKKK